MSGDPRTRQAVALAGGQPMAVAPRSLARLAIPELPARRSVEHAEQRPSGADQGDRYRPSGPAPDKVAGAVDRVNQPDQPARQPFWRIDGFFRQPPGRGQQLPQFALQEFIHCQVRRTDRAAAVLFPDRWRMAMARPRAERDLPGFAHDGFQTRTVDQERIPDTVKNDSQLAFIFLPWKGFEAFSRPLACA